MSKKDPHKLEYHEPLTDEEPFDFTRREPANWRVLIVAVAVGVALIILMPLLYLLARK